MDDRERRVLASATPVFVPVDLSGVVPIWTAEDGETGWGTPIVMRVTTLN